ncbi:GH92 family glycosyl hydrolase [Actinoplanes sp. NPDC026623]|uniref:GH92 family glycosyl hydrolase n=1 Tax=Actinoplanes sp. NPDC026623 TaxID=3155610 RepID=UPI0033EF0A73
MTRRSVLGGAGAAAFGLAATAATAGSLGLLPGAAGAAVNPRSEVWPFLGVDGGGEQIPGPYLPFGFAKPSPDTVGGDATSGYRSHRRCLGFSQTHVLGTGGGAKYGNFRITPITGSMNSIRPTTAIKAGAGLTDESAEPGYYGATLTRGGDAVKAALTATRLCAVHRYTFRAGRTANLLVDITSGIDVEWGQHPLSCQASFNDSGALEISGTFEGGWNYGRYKLYAVVVFSRAPDAYGMWDGDTVATGQRARAAGGVRETQRVGAYATFDTDTDQVVEVRVALSFKSIARAWENYAHQVSGKDFSAVLSSAHAAWDDALGRIAVDGGTPDQRSVFYTSLMQSHAMPHDLTGENVWWSSRAAHYEDYYTIWDTFRTVHPLLTLIQPRRQAEMVQSLVETYIHTGWMPDARIAGNNGQQQGGTNGDVLVADAMVKDLSGIDYRKAYEALRKNADEESADPSVAGRRMTDYKSNGGWIPIDQSTWAPADRQSGWWGRSASRTLEYNYNDFCVATVARGQGDTAGAARYRNRSKGWQNLWDPSTSAIRPRYSNRAWLGDYDKDRHYTGWHEPFYEGSGRQYSTFVPHDTQKVIDLVGGDDRYVSWLDDLFDGHYNHDNEPDLLAAWLYIHAGRPARTALRVRDILAGRYVKARDGLPGNNDAGALTAYYCWGAIGLFPNAGQPYYYIGSPIFTETRLKVAGGTFTIRAAGTSATDKYVQGATLNGRTHNRAWLSHREVAGGGTLVLTMGSSDRSAWGTGVNDRPASLSAG